MTICLRYAHDPMEAEDMMQEGFVSIFSSLSQFKSDGVLRAWMRRIMVNAALTVLRRKRISLVEVEDVFIENISIDTYSYAHLAEEDLMKLINALPDGYKLVFNLHIIEGYSHEEIAAMLGIQPSSSRSQLVKARKMLQQQILELQKIAV